jgi:fatty acid synthase
VVGALAEGGFLLLYEMTCSVPTLLWGLDARTWTFSDEREYGLWMAKPRWRRILQEAGLTLICEHWFAFTRTVKAFAANDKRFVILGSSCTSPSCLNVSHPYSQDDGLCRCPMETGCLFLWRKLPTNFTDVLLAAPTIHATDQEVAGFISEYSLLAETLEPIDDMLKADKAAADEADSKAVVEDLRPESACQAHLLCTLSMCYPSRKPLRACPSRQPVLLPSSLADGHVLRLQELR